MKIVLDTNVLVSGLLSPHGAPGQIVCAVAAGAVHMIFDSRTLVEYREVLLRPEFEFDPDRVENLLRQVEAEGELVVCQLLAGRLPDEDDEMFLEAAIAGAAAYLVTGNLRHYPPERRHGVKVIPPAQFVDRLRRQQM